MCLQILYVKQPPKETKTESGHVRSLPVYTGGSWSKNTANHFLLYFTWGLTNEIPKGPDIDRSCKSSSSHAGFFNLSRTPYYFTVYQCTTTFITSFMYRIYPAVEPPSCLMPFLILQSLPLLVKSPSRPRPSSSRCSLNDALMPYVRFHHLLSEVTFFSITPSNYITTGRHSPL